MQHRLHSIIIRIAVVVVQSIISVFCKVVRAIASVQISNYLPVLVSACYSSFDVVGLILCVITSSVGSADALSDIINSFSIPSASSVVGTPVGSSSIVSHISSAIHIVQLAISSPLFISLTSLYLVTRVPCSILSIVPLVFDSPFSTSECSSHLVISLFNIFPRTIIVVLSLRFYILPFILGSISNISDRSTSFIPQTVPALF